MQNQAEPKSPRYLTIREAAKYLGVSPWTLRNWDRDGKLCPARHPISGYRLYNLEELEAVRPKEGKYRPRSDSGHLVKWAELSESEHFVQFYESDRYLIRSVSSYVCHALQAGDGVVVIATPSHRSRISSRIKAAGIDVAAARSSGQYVTLDAAATLEELLLDGKPNKELFEAKVGSVIADLSSRHQHVRAFGEMVALLSASGNVDAACELEALWNKLAQKHSFALYCAYPLSQFKGQEASASFIAAESYASLIESDDKLRKISLLQQKAQALEAEVGRRMEVQQELADFLDSALEGIHQVAPDGTILWANKAELAMLGYSPEEYVGRNIVDFHVDSDNGDALLLKIGAGEKVINFPARLRCKDGSIRDVLIHSNGYFKEGKFIHSRCFTRDVTENVRAERDRALLAAIIESSDDSIISKSLDGIILSWNIGAERLFGYTAEEAVGRNIRIIIPPDHDQEEHDILARLRRGERLEHFETVRVAKDGRRIDISLTISPVRDRWGRIIGASKIARDITDRKRAERALMESEQRLREADRRKDEFLATLAHELRNPLAPIRNGLHILRLPGQPEEERLQVHAMIDRQMKQLVRLVDDLLEVSRISRGAIELQKMPVDIKDALDLAIETSRPKIEASDHELDVSLPSTELLVEGDTVRLAQVFSNLLNNAAKYTRPGGRISVVVTADGNEAKISVKDSGIGIPPAMLGRVFDMFVQADNVVGEVREGLGIGLSLAKTLVTMHGGRIEARSHGLGYGSEFVVSLPIATTVAADITEQTALVEEISTPRILVVDDNHDAADSLSLLLGLLGAEVRVSYGGESALALLNEFRPAVILLDIGMPGMDGYEVARRIREDSRYRDIILIALSGWGQEEDRRRSREAGFEHHLVKPLDLGALEALLRSLEKPKSGSKPLATHAPA